MIAGWRRTELPMVTSLWTMWHSQMVWKCLEITSTRRTSSSVSTLVREPWLVRDARVVFIMKRLMHKTGQAGALITLSMTTATMRRLMEWQDTQRWEMPWLPPVAQSSFQCAIGVRRNPGDGPHLSLIAGEQLKISLMTSPQSSTTSKSLRSTLRELDLELGLIQICLRLAMEVWLMKRRRLTSRSGLLPKHLWLSAAIFQSLHRALSTSWKTSSLSALTRTQTRPRRPVSSVALTGTSSSGNPKFMPLKWQEVTRLLWSSIGESMPTTIMSSESKT